MDKAVFLDTETGWLNDRKHSLLTIGYTVTNNQLSKILTKEYKVPIKGEVSQDALNINWLDVENWESERTVAEVVKEIIKDAEGDEVSLYWHNIHFDLWFIKTHDEEAYNELMSIFGRRIVDTKALIQDMKNRWLYDGSTSMHRFVWQDWGKHNAAEDTLLNIELLKKYYKMIT